MASITSMMNSTSSTSSIYGNRNVLSGLASGMDTESMIENAVSGIKLKIQNLLKKRTKVEWQQEAYRSIIDKAVNFNTKYTSYSSKTNLLSQSFFSNAVNTTTNGTYKDKVTASGKSSSDIQINAVKQMATAASYTVSGLAGQDMGEIGGVTGKDFDISGNTTVSTVSGSITFQYGGSNGTTFDIRFDELEDINEVEVLNADGSVKKNATSAEKLAQAINNKLSEITYSYTKNGFQETTTADKAVKVTADLFGGGLSFADGLGNGNKVSISSVSGDIKDTLGIEKGDTRIEAMSYDTSLTKQVKTSDYLADKELGITFNGTTKKISMNEVLERAGAKTDNDGFVKALNEELAEAFGTNKITASMDGDKLTFKPSGRGDTLSLGGSAIKAMGFESGDTNYINTTKKLSDLLGDRADTIFTEANRVKGTFEEGGKPIEKTSPNGTTYYVDDKGNRVDKDGYRIDSDGKALYDFQVNGAHINITEDTTLEGLMNSINSNPNAGVKVSYSKLTNEFKFTATETGANGKIEFSGLAESLFGLSGDAEVNDNFADNFGFFLDDGEKDNITVSFGKFNVSFDVDNKMTMQDFANELNNLTGGAWSANYNEKTGQFTVTDANGIEQGFTITDQYGFDYEREIEPVANYTAGRDAILDVEINGVRFENLTRSSNSFDLDGLTINVKGTFNEDGSNVDKDGNAIEPVSFTTTTDSDKIVDAIRSFVNDYNEMITELKSAYSTLPGQQSNGSRYEPLTAEQEDGMTESEIKAYEEKAKQGILFGDTTLSSMYSKMLNAIAPGGTDGQTLREIGIGTSYENGLTTISLDEDKLRAALESDPDKVKDAFTKTKENGSSTDGLMQTMQNTLNTYVRTAGEPKGVLITKAGSVKAPTSINNNSLQSQINNYDTQIERWQNKMSDQIDRYTTQFSRLEQLIAEMNSQASAMSGLMGGSSGY